MNVLVTGANGFIGGAVVEALLQSGHPVVACVHSSRHLPDSPRVAWRTLDFRECQAPSAWLPHLHTVDAVINCAGILRERKTHDFAAIHYLAPQALAEACIDQGIQRFVQISALGAPRDGLFIESKHRFDHFLLDTELEAIVIRPSVVLSLRGSYGGTSLLRALAALPFCLFLPGDGAQKMQPILLEDLAALAVKALKTPVPPSRLWIAVGPEVLSLRKYLSLLRAWLRLPRPMSIRIPKPLLEVLFAVAHRLGKGPMTPVIWKLLQRGNIGPADAYDELRALAGYAPRSVTEVLRNSASHVQDRWHARLYLLRPVMRWVLALVWLLSGLSGLLAQPERYRPILEALGVTPGHQAGWVIATSVLDIGLGAALLSGYRTRLAAGLMLCSVCAYTVLLGAFAPILWLDPLGGLLKNIPLLVMLVVYPIMEELR